MERVDQQARAADREGAALTRVGATGVDLGFTYRAHGSGTVDILHRGRVATTLRGAKARAFLDEVAAADHGGGQRLMARVTGNYKRGNERAARRHVRNAGG